MAVMKSDVSAGSDEYRRNRKVYDERIASSLAKACMKVCRPAAALSQASEWCRAAPA